MNNLDKLKEMMRDACGIQPYKIQEFTSSSDDHRVLFSKMCPVTNKEYIVEVENYSFRSWLSGAYAQDAFPELSVQQRDFIITHMTPEEYELAMKDTDES